MLNAAVYFAALIENEIKIAIIEVIDDIATWRAICA